MRPLTFWLGYRAERHAARFLRRRGFRILARNLRLGQDEIDLVALDGRTVVAVEVRYRSRGLIDAIESIDRDKRRALIRALHRFRTRERLWGVAVRIDLLALSRRRGRWEVAHLVDAVEGRDR